MSFDSLDQVAEWAAKNGGEKMVRQALKRQIFGTDKRSIGLVEEWLAQVERDRSVAANADERALREREVAAQESAVEVAQQAVASAAQELAIRLTDLASSVSRAGGLVAERADQLREQADAAGRAQARQQWALIFLTVVLAAATITYTWVTWQSVQVQREGNDVQLQLRDLQRGAQSAKPGKG